MIQHAIGFRLAQVIPWKHHELNSLNVRIIKHLPYHVPFRKR